MTDQGNCPVCRFMRGMAFGAIGGGVTGYIALAMGMQQSNAIIVAFFGALGLLLYVNRKREDR